MGGGGTEKEREALIKGNTPRKAEAMADRAPVGM